MRIAVSTLGCPSWSLEQVAAAARAYGYEGIELRLIDGEVITPDSVRANRARLDRLFRPDQLPIIGLGTSARFSMGDPAARRENEALAVEFIGLAAAMGVPMIRVFGGARPAGVDVARGIENVAEGLSRLAPAAEQAGVTVALETHDDFSSAAVVAQVMQRVPSQHVAVIWDMHHTYRAGEGVEQVWELIGSRIAHVHVKDARHGGERPVDGLLGTGQLVLLGEGEVPVKEGIRLLRARGYTGSLSVEWEKKWHPEIPEPEVAFPQHMEVVRLAGGAELSCSRFNVQSSTAARAPGRL